MRFYAGYGPGHIYNRFTKHAEDGHMENSAGLNHDLQRKPDGTDPELEPCVSDLESEAEDDIGSSGPASHGGFPPLVDSQDASDSDSDSLQWAEASDSESEGSNTEDEGMISYEVEQYERFGFDE